LKEQDGRKNTQMRTTVLRVESLPHKTMKTNSERPCISLNIRELKGRSARVPSTTLEPPVKRNAKFKWTTRGPKKKGEKRNKETIPTKTVVSQRNRKCLGSGVPGKVRIA